MAKDVYPPRQLYRIQRGAELKLPSWERASTEGIGGLRTFGSRFDDPKGEFRTLYTSASVAGAFAEILQVFMPDPEFAAVLDEEHADAEPDEERPSTNVITASFLSGRYLFELATNTPKPFFNAVGAESLALVRKYFSTILGKNDVSKVTTALLLDDSPIARYVTCWLARYAHERQYAGITSISKQGGEFETYALFETGRDTERYRQDFAITNQRRIEMNDPDLVDAVNLHGLLIETDKGAVSITAKSFWFKAPLKIEPDFDL